MALTELDLKYESYREDVESWLTETYKKNFSWYFEDVHELIERMGSKYRAITDAELEQILVYLPLKLFEVSEVLNNFKISLEAIKIEVKKAKSDIIQNSAATSQVKKKEEAESATLDDELLIKAYTVVINRVESEISLSKELIMSAKKIWTSRKQSELVGTSGESVTDLPDYDSISHKEYIK